MLTNLESLPRGIQFWRATTHFFGGMGVLVLCVAILPFLRVGGMQVYRAEMPGPLAESVRAGLFQATSILTTTGFVTEDFNL